MNTEIKERWIAALESGEYTQGTGALRTADNMFCCLGVLCDLYLKDHGLEWEYPPESDSSEDDACVFPDPGRDIAFVPEVVQEWAEIDGPDPVVEHVMEEGGRQAARTLSLINDAGASFDKIAGLIRDRL